MNMLSRFLGLFSNDIGIDLGTANTLVYVKDRGIVLREPSVVAVQAGTKRILAVGEEAKRMLGRTPGNIQAIRPMKAGVIADFDITEAMLRYFIKKIHNRKKMVRPRIIIAVPSDITEVEKRAVKDSASRAGAREVFLIEEPMASAIGSGLAIEEPNGNMIVDIGGGTTEIAVISLSGIVVSRSIRVAGHEMDQEIINYAKKYYNLLLGERTAEDIKIEIGSAYSFSDFDRKKVVMRGRDLVSGLPKAIEIGAEEVRKAISGPVAIVVSAIKEVIEETPPELLADVMKQGIMLSGGGALVRGIDKLISDKTGVPVRIADDPLTGVVRGTAVLLEHLDLLEKVKISDHGR